MKSIKRFFGVCFYGVLLIGLQTSSNGFCEQIQWQDITRPYKLNSTNISASNPLTVELYINTSLLPESKQLELYLIGNKDEECDPFVRINDSYQKNIYINRWITIKLKPGSNTLFFSDKHSYGNFNIYELQFKLPPKETEQYQARTSPSTSIRKMDSTEHDAVINPGKTEKPYGDYPAIMAGLSPEDRLEELLMKQMTVTYHQAIETFRIANDNKTSVTIFENLQNQGIELMRLFNQQLETLERYRRKGQAEK